MFKVRVEAWTDWSTGRPRPAFTVQGVYEGGGGSPLDELSEELATSVAVGRLERELAAVSANPEGLVPLVDPQGYSLYALYALFLLAAARANVNPTHVDFDHRNYWGFTLPMLSPSMVIRLLLGEVFDPHLNAMKNAVEIKRVLLDDKVYATWEVLDALAQLVSGTGDNPDPHTRFWLIYLAKTLHSEALTFNNKVNRVLRIQNVEGILRRAAEEARDPDLKRLAGILAELTRKAVEMADTIERHLHPADLNRLLNMLGSTMVFKRGKEELLERLRAARDEVRLIENEAHKLSSQAEEVIERLQSKSVLLDVESEEDIKRRLLEA